MLEHVPHWLGEALANFRAGADRLAIGMLDLEGVAPIRLSSPDFADGARLPERFTADGEGVSPPLRWSGLPDGAVELALIVEDPDAPAPRPFVHAILTAIDPAFGALEEGAIRADGDGGAEGDSGRNSYLREGWLPPDPPTGHGEHRYVFQLFALAAGQNGEATPGRAALIEQIEGRVIGAGVLTGTYSRGEGAPEVPAGAAFA